jgi:hypothetical protein
MASWLHCFCACGGTLQENVADQTLHRMAARNQERKRKALGATHLQGPVLMLESFPLVITSKGSAGF